MVTNGDGWRQAGYVAETCRTNPFLRFSVRSSVPGSDLRDSAAPPITTAMAVPPSDRTALNVRRSAEQMPRHTKNSRSSGILKFEWIVTRETRTFGKN
jgi:hypothetical protein